MNNKVIRIAQIMGKMNSGGVESVVMNYYKNIDKEKVQFDFIVDEDSTYIPYEEIESMGGRVFLVPPYQKINLYIKTLQNIFESEKYRIVHSHLNSLSVFPLYAAKKADVAIRIAHSHSTSNKKEWKKNIMKYILRPFSKINATHYFCCSEHAGRWLFGNKAYDENKVVLINNAIDIYDFIYNEQIRYKIRKKLNIEDKLVIGHIGRFVEQKNHEKLIDIFYELHKKNESTVLLLVGEGPLLEKIKSKVSNLGLNKYVIFLGRRDDVKELMQGMDVFLFPSLYEGLGLVLIEVQAAGLPCITSTEVPTVANIADLVEFIPLSSDSITWCKVLLNKYKDTVRKSSIEDIYNSGYDIKKESQNLLEIYCKYNGQ